MTQTYYKAFAPRIGIAWSPGNSGKTSIRAGWGLFYNPVEQLVLAQFGAEPPFGGSTTVNETQFNLPFLGQDSTVANPITTYLNPFNGVLSPQRGTLRIGRYSSLSICTAISSRICGRSIPPNTTSPSSAS